MPQYSSGISPNKFPQGRVIAKARRPSQHLGGGVLSPGGPPFSPSTHSDLLRYNIFKTFHKKNLDLDSIRIPLLPYLTYFKTDFSFLREIVLTWS